MRTCDIHPVDEALERKGATLRTAVDRAPSPSAIDAIVVALADGVGGATILTGDLPDLQALSHQTVNEVRIRGD